METVNSTLEEFKDETLRRLFTEVRSHYRDSHTLAQAVYLHLSDVRRSIDTAQNFITEISMQWICPKCGVLNGSYTEKCKRCEKLQPFLAQISAAMDEQLGGQKRRTFRRRESRRGRRSRKISRR
jgi:hypothetical protein